MTLFDTHCHFETTDESVIRATLERAKAAGVEVLMAVGGSDTLNEAALAAQRVAEESRHTFYKKCDEATLPRVIVALGYDREQVGLSTSGSIRSAWLVDSLDNGRAGCAGPLFIKSGPGGASRKIAQLEEDGKKSVVPHSPTAVGEIGLDYYYSPETREAQLKLFGEQLELAREKNLPVVIHTREADDDTLALLREIPSRGIIHCYTGTPEAARRFLDLGFYISISGIVTFRAADNVRAAARVVPDDRILIETDAPFLAPVPMRGKPNEPAFVAHTCAFLAHERGMSADDFADLTFANAERVLGR